MASMYKRAFRQKWAGTLAVASGSVPAAAGFLTGKHGTRIVSGRLQNRSANPGPVALVGLLKDTIWQAGQWVDATTTYNDDTPDAQSAGADDFALESATSNDGFIVSADVPFGAVSLVTTTAGAAAADAHTAEFWNPQAAQWTGVAAAGLLIDIARATSWGVGENLILFDPPSNWGVGGSGTNVPQNRYNLRVRRQPTTPSASALASRIYVGEVFWSEDAVPVNGAIERFMEFEPFVIPPYVTALGMANATLDEGNSLELVLM